MKFLWVGVVLLMSISGVTAQISRYTPLKSGSPLQDRDFYFFTLLEQPICREQLQKDSFLTHRLGQFMDTLSQGSPGSPNALARSFIWSGAEMEQVGAELGMIGGNNPKMLNWLCHEMRRSGYWVRDEKLEDTALIRKGWMEAAAAQNKVILTYTTNKGFRYPDIDSAAHAPESPEGQALMAKTISAVKDSRENMHLFFQPGLAVALGILQFNKRDQAIRFLPLDSANKEPYAAVRHTSWKKYPFSAIVVLGAGPEGDSAISPEGKQRCQTAAEAWKQGRAPFLIVSGGFVHPFQTPYCEADQMKKYLVQTLGIPASAIILEPHARHTTTNIRNANRILIRQGFPLKERVLCISSPLHILVVVSPLFSARCLNELGYIPYGEMKPEKGKGACSYIVGKASLQLDATDPLDP